MINPDTLLHLSPERRAVLFDLSDKQTTLLFRMENDTFLHLLDTDVEVLQGLLNVALAGQEDAMNAFDKAIAIMARPEQTPAEQTIAVLLAAAALQEDKSHKPNLLGDWDRVLPKLDQIQWDQLCPWEMGMTFGLLDEVHGWLRLNIPYAHDTDGASDADATLLGLEKYIAQRPAGSVTGALIQAIKTEQQGRYVLGTGAHNAKDPAIIDAYLTEWRRLQSAFTGWSPAMVDVVLRSNLNAFTSIYSSIVDAGATREELKSFLKEKCRQDDTGPGVLM